MHSERLARGRKIQQQILKLYEQLTDIFHEYEPQDHDQLEFLYFFPDMLADGHHRFVASRLVTKRRPHLALVVSALLPVIYLEDVNIDESDRGKYFYEWEDLPFR
jgi:hypothetical protein